MTRNILDKPVYLTMRSLFCIAFVIVFFSCKKEKKEPSAPVVETVGTSQITDSSFLVGGKVTYDGSKEITAAGFCYSTLTTGPTISDDTISLLSHDGTFAWEFLDLDPTTTYYVRAFAVNELGVGYGNVFTVSTLNGVPRVVEVHVEGVAIIDSVLRGFYTYSDFENDPDSASVFQWFVAGDTTSGFDTPIPGANTATYTVSVADTLQYIRFGVTPFAASGASPGGIAKSAWIGPVPK